jgi:nucleotide-binding universal stress UspA family protein
MKKILIPTDFSKASIIALEAGIALASRVGASITLLHVIEESTPESYSIVGQGHPSDSEQTHFTMELIRKSRHQLERLVTDPRFNQVEINGELRIGNPYHGIRTIIAEHSPDLVVMGTRGHSELEEMIIGSNTERVVRHMSCPVLTLHRKPVNAEFKDIVYATCMSEDEEDFVQVIKPIQKIYNSTIHIVRINTPADFQRDRSVINYMEKFAKKLGLKNFTLNVFNDLTAEEGIIYFADQIKADLICMATHGRTGFAHVLAGSIAEDVVNHSRRPVLTSVIKK